MEDERIQGLVFGEVAEAYHAARPRYPAAVVADTLEFGPVDVPGRALDVGAGTGIATAAFAAAGLSITAVEPNTQMVEVARRHLPDVEFAVSTFEEWQSDGKYDLVFSAQAWHWIDPVIGFARAHTLLGPAGVLALIWNLEDRDQPGRPPELDLVYDRFAAEHGRSASPARLRSPEELSADLAQTPLFTIPERRTYPWEAAYSTDDFLRLQMTHSPKRMLPPDHREALLSEIAAVLDANGGALTVRYTTNLFLARPL